MEKKNIPLNELKVGQRGTVSQLLSDTSMRRRLQDIGLIEGTKSMRYTKKSFRMTQLRF